ncbi:MAG: D-alanyl-D-alanine carboxypeptidase [Ruminococcaceae bacterium]|nr:D-alanyl-D-alanine carboxypeptidase [Oscillospiraceae bacterium]
MYKFGVFFRKVFICFFILVLLVISAFAVKPQISAESAILINISNGDVVAEYNADKKQGMASTTKIMTAIIAIEHGDLDKNHTIPAAAIGVEGSSLYLKADEVMTLRELVMGLMLQSANDAAEAIAIIVGGSVENFVSMMNEKALELGLSNTHFTNPHGLANDNHYTTARELAKIAEYSLRNETFRSICSSKRATLPGKEFPRTVTNHNKMLSIYDGAFGVKTGFTKATGRCLVSAAKRNGVELVAVTLNASNDWNDHAAMLDYGFDQYELVSLASAGEKVYDLPIIGGDMESISVYIKNDVTVCLKKNRKSIVEKIQINRPRFAPIYKDDEVGRIVFFTDGKEIASSPLCAKTFIGTRN